MIKPRTLGQLLRERGVSRRGFLKYCAVTASSMALSPAMIPTVARALEQARRPSIIWLSFQECTGCTEALTRSHAPTLESLILEAVSLDYHHTLQAASGHAAEEARATAMKDNHGKYLLVVDGSIPTGAGGAYSTIAGISNLQMLEEAAAGAAAVIAVGSCAAFGGLPYADPNPTGAKSVSELLPGKPVVNISGCPPIPVVISGVLAHFLTFGKLPELDSLGRPLAFFGQNIHDRCYRRPFYERGLFAETFDDEGAKKGWCLFKLGCKGPVTYNACATTKWNDGTSFPIQAGHGCIGCSEPNFWDMGGFYNALSESTVNLREVAGYSLAGGALAGAAVGLMNRSKKKTAVASHRKVSVDDLEKEEVSS